MKVGKIVSAAVEAGRWSTARPVKGNNGSGWIVIRYTPSGRLNWWNKARGMWLTGIGDPSRARVSTFRTPEAAQAEADQINRITAADA